VWVIPGYGASLEEQPFLHARGSVVKKDKEIFRRLLNGKRRVKSENNRLTENQGVDGEQSVVDGTKYTKGKKGERKGKRKKGLLC